jgi:hypothetical protein
VAKVPPCFGNNLTYATGTNSTQTEGQNITDKFMRTVRKTPTILRGIKWLGGFRLAVQFTHFGQAKLKGWATSGKVSGPRASRLGHNHELLFHPYQLLLAVMRRHASQSADFLGRPFNTHIFRHSLYHQLKSMNSMSAPQSLVPGFPSVLIVRRDALCGPLHLTTTR